MKIKKMENLWVAANKLRGAFEITELYKVMLYGLLFKYLELKRTYSVLMMKNFLLDIYR